MIFFNRDVGGFLRDLTTEMIAIEIGAIWPLFHFCCERFDQLDVAALIPSGGFGVADAGFTQ